MLKWYRFFIKIKRWLLISRYTICLWYLTMILIELFTWERIFNSMEKILCWSLNLLAQNSWLIWSLTTMSFDVSFCEKSLQPDDVKSVLQNPEWSFLWAPLDTSKLVCVNTAWRYFLSITITVMVGSKRKILSPEECSVFFLLNSSKIIPKLKIPSKSL